MRLEDYGMSGDLQTAALVGRDLACSCWLGNFPQAFSHLTLLLAAREISKAEARGSAEAAGRDAA